MSRSYFTHDQIARAKRLRDGGYSYQAIGDRMGMPKNRIQKLASRGWCARRKKVRACPPDLFWRSKELTKKQLKVHYRVGGVLLNQWLSQAKIERDSRRYIAPCRAMPEGFVAVATAMTHRGAMRHFHTTGRVITRWKREAGLPTPRSDILRRRKQAVERKVGWVERYVADLGGVATGML